MPAVVPLIIAGVSAASSVAAAKVQANAARDAANTQTQAGNRALGVQNQMWQQQQARQQPFVDVATPSLLRLQQQAQQPRPAMPMFNPQAQNGGWNQQNWQQQNDPNRYLNLFQMGQQGGR